MNNEWKVIEGFPNYKVSLFGEFFNVKRDRPVRSLCGPDGYCRVKLTNIEGRPKMLLAHRLVAKAFVPNPENKSIVNHKDGNRNNNYFKNLEWVTSSENKLHGYRILGHKMTEETKKKISEKHLGKRLTDEHKDKISQRLKGHITSKETREKISKANKSSHNTLEYKTKMSKIRKAYFERQKS